jgi:hypothetical protein
MTVTGSMTRAINRVVTPAPGRFPLLPGRCVANHVRAARAEDMTLLSIGEEVASSLCGATIIEIVLPDQASLGGSTQSVGIAKWQVKRSRTSVSQSVHSWV